jgi:hypothetical protein
MRLTVNDRRVLQAAAKAFETWEGIMPHGSADWTAIRRLEREQLVDKCNDWADCQTCAQTHEGPAFAITVWGWRALVDTDEGLS